MNLLKNNLKLDIRYFINVYLFAFGLIILVGTVFYYIESTTTPSTIYPVETPEIDNFTPTPQITPIILHNKAILFAVNI